MTSHTSKPSLSLVNYITGITDGLLVPMIPCGLIGLYFSKSLLMAFSIFFIIACIGALIYGLARYWGEQNEIRHNHPDIAGPELQKDAYKLRQIGIDETVVSEMILQVEKEQSDWLREIQLNDMDWTNFDSGRARKSGIQTGLGFLTGAWLAASPFPILFVGGNYKFICFTVIELSLMFSFGWLKGKCIHKNPLTLAVKQILLCIAILILLAIGSILLID